jgi:nucleotide-binding universal stress UspA family protein
VFRNILVATDLEPESVSARAVDLAIDLAKALGAALTFVHVHDFPAVVAYPHAAVNFASVQASILEAAGGTLVAFADSVRDRFPEAKSVLRRGRPWEEILAAAVDVEADLIVIGTHGRRGVSRVVLGSVAEKVVRVSPVPVLTVRGG